MNGYKLMAENYKALLEREEFTPEELEDFKRHIKIFEFFATCTDEDFFVMFDSAAFNDIVKGYCVKAAEHYAKSHDMDEDSAEDFRRDLLNEIRAGFSEMTARDAIRKYYD